MGNISLPQFFFDITTPQTKTAQKPISFGWDKVDGIAVTNLGRAGGDWTPTPHPPLTSSLPGPHLINQVWIATAYQCRSIFGNYIYM